MTTEKEELVVHEYSLVKPGHKTYLSKVILNEELYNIISKAVTSCKIK